MRTTGSMLRELFAGKGRKHRGIFLAFSLVVILIVILISKDITTAVVLVGLITNFLIISSQLIIMSDIDEEKDSKRNQALGSVMVNPVPMGTQNGFDGSQEGFIAGATTAPPGYSDPFWMSIPPSDPPTEYPGAIDHAVSTYSMGKDDITPETAPALGHIDWTVEAHEEAPVGNPYATDRIYNPQAAAPCIDDEATAYFDGDELNTYQVRSRNDPERVWAGIYRRKALVERYVNEELDETEQSQWWGRHEW